MTDQERIELLKKQMSFLRAECNSYRQRYVQNMRTLVTKEHLRNSTILAAASGFVLGLLVQGLV